LLTGRISGTFTKHIADKPLKRKAGPKQIFV